jgi:hypothetical protein
MDNMNMHRSLALRQELEIAGNFIYDGMRDLDGMNNYFEDEKIFSFLYKISVGVERLQKIAFVLLKSPHESGYETIEKELKTHSHTELQRKIKELANLNISEDENELIDMLCSFYKAYRYNRFNSNTKITGERNIFIQYIEKRLKKIIETKGIFAELVARIDEEDKQFLGKIIGSIVSRYYELIRDQCGRLNIYTYELKPRSKSMKIFQRDCNEKNLRQQFIKEQIAYKEFMIFLINTTKSSGLYDFIKEIPPLDIDISLIQDYLFEIIRGDISQDLIDTIYALYSEQEDGFNLKERLESLKCIGDPNYCFTDEDDCFDDLSDPGFRVS